MTPTDDFIRALPKAELHMHIEGSFEPDLMFEIAGRNGVDFPFDSVEEVRAAYEFENLQSFLDIYYQGMNVLRREQDFHDLTHAYLERAHADGVVHTEIFFDPQGHTGRGVAFETVLDGIWRALRDGEREFGISSCLIMCFLRHLSEEDAFRTLDQALEHRDRIAGVGLDSSEVGHPPAKFERVFRKACEAGFVAVAHAGEEGPPAYVREALDLLQVTRIDHGNRAMEAPDLIERLVREQVPLTVCPLSNLKLCVVDDLRKHPLKRMLEAGIVATINSDDPAYFGGYVLDNFRAVRDALALSAQDIATLARNSITASLAEDEWKARRIGEIEALQERTYSRTLLLGRSES
ncbi:MAG: adenosine deaminase [Gammaproteobacteria bacterium]|nr:adenosine deaminase [Gammaproteobacteria bacterium]MYE30125.1 adenosine deaminase [Gammaproteobacteria bacterium]MYI01126.1 adenosine deaminase [Gammaproteobacteria bacterium]